MDLTNLTLTQILAWILSTLAGMILGSIIIPKPVKGGFFTVLLGGIIGAVAGAFVARQMLFSNLNTPDLRVLSFFFLGALVGVVLFKLLFQETKRFRTESS